MSSFNEWCRCALVFPVVVLVACSPAHDEFPDGRLVVADAMSATLDGRNVTLDAMAATYDATVDARAVAVDAMAATHDATVDAPMTATIDATIVAAIDAGIDAFVDHAPAASSQSVTLFANTSTSMTLSASDVDGDSLTYAVVNAPLHGVLGGAAPNLTYTPTVGYSGADSFTFKANDGTFDSAAATVAVTVNADPMLSAESLNVSNGSMMQTPTITATATAVNTAITNFYVSSSAAPDCTGTAIGATNASSISLQLSSVGAAGPKFIHYLSYDTDPANTNGCTYTGLHYIYADAPLLAFSQSSYAIAEADGTTQISATTVRVTRTDGNGTSVTGGASSVTLTPAAVVAQEGFSTTPVAINFGANDSFIDVAVSNFAVTNNTTIDQDPYFKVALTSPTGGSVDIRSRAKVFIIDDETSGDLMFADTLITSQQSTGAVTVRVWRAGATDSAATATLDFRDGSAIGGADYDNTPKTITFAAGQSEVTQTIAIVDHGSTSAPATSFYIELDTPSTSTRPQSMAKVRILNDHDTSFCDATNANASIHSGFGGGSGTASDPFLICSVAQLAKAQNFLTANFKLAADLDGSALLASTASFSGQFNGNERTIENIGQTSTVATAGALFGILAGNGVIENLNFDDFSLTCSTPACGGVVDVLGNSATDNVALANLYVSGLMVSTGSPDYGLIAGATGASDPTQTLKIANLFTAGSLIDNQTIGGSMIGNLAPSGSVSVVNAINVAYLNSAGGNAVGGLFGLITGAVGATVTIDHLENRGFVNTGSGNGCGGVAGEITLNNSATASITNVINHGTMASTSSGGSFAGIFGAISLGNNTDITVDALTNTGDIADTGKTLTYQAGILGVIAPLNNITSDVTASFTNLTNSGAISALGSCNGGIIGWLGENKMFWNSTFTLSKWNNTGSITATDFQGGGDTGGLIGMLGGEWDSGTTFTLTDMTNSGAVTEYRGGNESTGGLIGTVILDLDTMVIQGNVVNSGNVTGSSTTNQVGGLIGLIQFIHVPDNASFSLSSTATSAVTSDVTVSGQNDLGGAIGEIVNVVGPVSITSIRSDAAVIGASSSSSFAGGIVGLIQHGGAGANFSLTLSLVTNTGTVQQGNYVGGVVGDLAVTGSAGNIFPATLDTLVSTGDVETFSKSSPATSNGIGGLIGNMSGTNFSTVTLSNSLASGNVNSLGQTGVGVMGGLVGIAGCGANTSCTRSITSSIATGNVTAAQDGGGFIGDYDNCSGTSVCALDIAQSYSTGTVTDSAGGTYFGGFIGCVINPSNASLGNLTIENSYTTSPVISTEGGSDYGGFIGRILNAGITAIDTSYADNVLSGPVAGSGFVQANDGTLIVTDTYSLSSNPEDGYATALSNEAFVDAVNFPTNFVGFDFTTVWYPPDGSNPPTLW